MNISDSELTRAKQKGLAILAYSAYSAKAVKTKLMQKGFSEEISESVIEYLTEKGFLNEVRDATRLCESLLKKKYGRKRILSSLRAKGYGDDAFCAAEEFLDEVDFVGLCRQVIDAKWGQMPKDLAEMQKAIAKLVALGYNVGEIKNAMRQ